MLMNIVHGLVTSSAMILASALAIGFTFAMITGRKRRLLFLDDEE